MAGNSTITKINIGGGGEANTASNLGDGVGLFDAKVAEDLQFKSLKDSPTVTFTDNGDGTVSANSTASGSGITVETPEETPDSIIVDFAVSAEPKWVVADGITHFDGAGYTYTPLLVTMDLAPSSFIRVII